MAQPAQRSCGCLIPGRAQWQAGWGHVVPMAGDWDSVDLRVPFSPSYSVIL